MVWGTMFKKAISLIAISLLAGCGPRSVPPRVDQVLVSGDTTLRPGESRALTIAASGKDVRFEWSVQRGSLSDPSKPAVVYTAPDSPGLDIVTVVVTYETGQMIRSVTFDIVEPPALPATATLVPSATPTAVPEPLACNSPAITKNLFPQLAEVNEQFSFYGPPEEPKYTCEAVYDIVHNQPLAVHIKYKNAGANYGWWGISTPNGYDASYYSQICFWVYAQTPNQAFRLKMKDTNMREDGVDIIIEPANQWTEICTDLTEFTALSVRLDSLENVNLGFEQPTGSAEVWVADFEFK